MHWLEHRIPPPVVALLVGASMWGLARVSPAVQVDPALRIAVAIALAVLGIATGVSGVIAFRRSGTTTNPLKPGAASSLVVGGVYRHTRNPMYLGLAFVLLGWAAYLAAPLALLGPPIFVLFITRFQIIPEESALAEIFGQQFTAYRSSVRRWL